MADIKKMAALSYVIECASCLQLLNVLRHVALAVMWLCTTTHYYRVGTSNSRFRKVIQRIMSKQSSGILHA